MKEGEITDMEDKKILSEIERPGLSDYVAAQWVKSQCGFKGKGTHFAFQLPYRKCHWTKMAEYFTKTSMRFQQKSNKRCGELSDPVQKQNCIHTAKIKMAKFERKIELAKAQLQKVLKKMNEGEITNMEDKKIIQAENMVDGMLDNIKVDVQIADDMVDNILDDMDYRRPYDHPKKMRVTTGVEGDEEDSFDDNHITKQEPSDEEDSRKVSNALNNVPNQDAGTELTGLKSDLGGTTKVVDDGVADSDEDESEIEDDSEIGESYSNIMKLGVTALIDENSGYKEFFKSMLSKYGVNSPKELEGEKRKEFFNAVDKGWKGKKETD